MGYPKTASIQIDSDSLTIEQVVAIARDGLKVTASEAGHQRVKQAYQLVSKWVAEKKVIYGITTGFGALCDVPISFEDTRVLQSKIFMSHAAGVGAPLASEVVRAVMAIRLHDLFMGYAGCSCHALDYLIAFLNQDLIPVVPEKGSVGASGDLAPMAHLGLVLIGQGEAFFKGQRLFGADALTRIGLKPLKLGPGEGLALINGTQVMTAIAALVVYDAVRLAKLADVACAMSLEVLMGSNSEFDPRIHQIRPHPGQVASARNMLRLLEQSEVLLSHEGCARIQDAYTLRCSPQIHGASKDSVIHARKVVGIEINSTTTNPLIFVDTGEIRLGGNFHGQPIAMAADYLSMGIAELGNVSERRIERLVNPQLSELPAFLIKDGGLNSGLMIAQYTAAALVSENKVLAHPACVDSIPTSANKEDHVSMGTIAIRQTREILDNVTHIIAVELICAAQAYDLLTLQKKLKAGKGTAAAYQIIRKKIPFLDQDRVLAMDIEAMVTMIKNNEILAAVEKAVGTLQLSHELQ
jgi:histidine ammonia-lyase